MTAIGINTCKRFVKQDEARLWALSARGISICWRFCHTGW
jgi:hypothetical protein